VTDPCPLCFRPVEREQALCPHCGAQVPGRFRCKDCKSEIPAGSKKCPYCWADVTPAAPPPSTAPADPRIAIDLFRLRTDVRARVMWGEDPKAIRAELVRQGLSKKDQDAVLGEALQERNQHFRQKGVVDLTLGVLCAVGFLATLVFWYFSGGRVNFKGLGALVLLIVAFPVASVLFLFRGIKRLARGGKGEAEASDVSQST